MSQALERKQIMDTTAAIGDFYEVALAKLSELTNAELMAQFRHANDVEAVA